MVLAGDTSLTCAVLAGDWVTSHERLGRNRDAPPVAPFAPAPSRDAAHSAPAA